jgi:hypothetical protein
MESITYKRRMAVVPSVCSLGGPGPADSKEYPGDQEVHSSHETHFGQVEAVTEPRPGGRYIVRPFRDDDCAAVLAVLNSAFQRDRSMSWFQWKHQASPWGPSVGWVAHDSDGVIAAVRLMTPWLLSSDDEPVPIERAMDGSVSTEARRQGLFSRCVAAEMTAISSGERCARLVYATPVPASREAFRKLNWVISDVPHTVRLALPAPMAAVALEWDDALDVGEIPRGPRWSTAWTASALRWRINPLSGNAYRTVRLRESDAHHGLILRRTRLKGIPTLVAVYSWGPDRETRTLTRAAATCLGTPLVLSAGSTTSTLAGKVVGSSVVSAWSPQVAVGEPDDMLRRLPLQFAELEGAM